MQLEQGTEKRYTRADGGAERGGMCVSGRGCSGACRDDEALSATRATPAVGIQTRTTRGKTDKSKNVHLRGVG